MAGQFSWDAGSLPNLDARCSDGRTLASKLRYSVWKSLTVRFCAPKIVVQ